MPISFPSNPTLNQTYPAAGDPAINGRRWKWTGTTWDALSNPPDWTEIANKPATFPPTVPIPSTDISGLAETIQSNTTLQSQLNVIAVSQGGYNNGDVIPQGTSLETVVRNMLRLRIPPTYLAPQATLTVPTGTDLQPEFGTNISVLLTAGFNQRNGGSASQFRVKRGSTTEQTTNGTTPANYTATFQLLTNESWTHEADYEQGPIINDNFGDPSPSGRIAAGTAVSAALQFQPRRATWWKTDTVLTAPNTSALVRGLETGGNKVLGHANGSAFRIVIPAGTRRVVFAYPASLRAVQSVSYVQLGGGSVKDLFNETEVQVEGANSSQAIAYRVYTYVAGIAFGDTAFYDVVI